ncbi:MAG: CPBP family intramembrane metalloprotease [Methanosarcinaceae archaeon]|nr:CPBP family intramembrane metalloprotease [Methanosarcinaceae archaeon]
MELKKIELNRSLATLFIVIIFAAIVISEYTFVYYDAGYGIVLCLFVTIAIYIIISAVRMDDVFITAAESLALIPIYVLFTSSLPWFFIDQQFLLPAVYSIILALCFWHMYEKKIPFSRVGFTGEKLLKYALIGVVIGFFTGQIEYLVIRPEPSFPTFELKYLFRDLIFMTLFVGVGEELLFRGLIQNDLIDAFGARMGILGQAFIFGVMHLSWRSSMELAFTFFAGLLFGILYYRTRSLTGPIALHGFNNTMLVAILPYYFAGLII